jgi:uncharacterized protein (TIGR02145 family)
MLHPTIFPRSGRLGWSIALVCSTLALGCSKDDSTPTSPESGAVQGTVTDVDGNVYQTAKIGNQWWMTENLKVTHYRNGESILIVTDRAQWASLVSGGCCCYDNQTSNVAPYGRLYNWFAIADTRGIAPQGWHVPTDAEWQTLERHLGMSQGDAGKSEWRGSDEGGKLKSTTAHWKSPNTGATNTSNFSALPSGGRSSDPGYAGNYYYQGELASFWSSSEDDGLLAWYRDLSYSRSEIYRATFRKQNGFALRCVKD